MFYINELQELKKDCCAWAYDSKETNDNPHCLLVEGLSSWLGGCIVYLFHYGKSTTEDLTECFAWCSGGLWECGDSSQHEALTIKSGKYKGYCVKGARITKAGRPLLELWNDKENIIVLSN